MGRIDDILADTHEDKAIVIIDVFEVASTRHALLDMPWLVRRQDELSYVIVTAAVRALTMCTDMHDC